MGGYTGAHFRRRFGKRVPPSLDAPQRTSARGHVKVPVGGQPQVPFCTQVMCPSDVPRLVSAHARSVDMHGAVPNVGRYSV